MKTEKLGMEPAFPVGMSKRFYAACAAMQGIISSLNPASTASPKSIARDAFIYADELLKQDNS